MGRQSDPNQGLTQDRFRVWNSGDDQYSRAELEENWDTLDAILGRPADGVTVWPPLNERGVGKGLWLLFQRLEAEKFQLGDVKWVYAPTDTALTATITAQQAGGFEVANGQQILAANHDFGDLDASLNGEDIYLPDMIGHSVRGVADDATVGEAGGITVNDGVENVNPIGADTFDLNVVIAGHTHTVAAHSHSVSAHTHGMNHKHRLHDPGDLVANQTLSSYYGVAYQLRSGAVAATLTNSGSGAEYTENLNPDTGNFVYLVPGMNHRHDLRARPTSTPRRGADDGPGFEITSTDSGGSGSTSSTALTTASGGSVNQHYEVDTVPLSVGLVPFIKVRNATGL